VSRTVFTLRSYLYQNLSQIIDNIAEFIDSEFLVKMLKPIIEDDGKRQGGED
jgi:hypothetical protein